MPQRATSSRVRDGRLRQGALPAFAPVPRQDAEMPSVKQEAAEQAPASEKEASQLALELEGSEGASDTGAGPARMVIALRGHTDAEETSESESSGSSSPDPAEAVVAPANACEAQEEPARGRSRSDAIRALGIGPA